MRCKLTRDTLLSGMFCAGLALPASLLGFTSAYAGPPMASPMIATPDTDAAVRTYWTPERLLAAKPMPLKRVPGAVHKQAFPKFPSGARAVFKGGAPTEAYDGSLATELYDPNTIQHMGQTSPFLSGGAGYPFSTNRLLPTANLFKAYPYATYGHLFFTTPAGNFQCSASVIRLNTIATAGHCVNDGNTNYYTNWLFIPAANGSHAPFGSWTWANADTTSAWYTGGGVVPNAQDDAVIVLNQQNYKKVLHKVGDLVGYLGYEFNAALPTAITQIGYPCNLDSCSDPIATYSQMNGGPTGNFEWGTASFGGASGGPEIQDFGVAPSGVPTETLGGNIVISSTSYTYATTTEVDGGSAFQAPGQGGAFTFGDDINYACSVGGC